MSRVNFPSEPRGDGSSTPQFTENNCCSQIFRKSRSHSRLVNAAAREFDTFSRRDIVNLKRGSDGMVGADRLMTLTRLSSKGSAAGNQLRVKVLLDSAEAGRDRHAINLPGSHTGKAKTVGELKVIRDCSGTMGPPRKSNRTTRDARPRSHQKRPHTHCRQVQCRYQSKSCSPGDRLAG